jgi:hypothetical protein
MDWSRDHRGGLTSHCQVGRLDDVLERGLAAHGVDYPWFEPVDVHVVKIQYVNRAVAPNSFAYRRNRVNGKIRPADRLAGSAHYFRVSNDQRATAQGDLRVRASPNDDLGADSGRIA